MTSLDVTNADAFKQQQILNYFLQLKSDENAWRKAIATIQTNANLSNEECFLWMQVVEDFLATRYFSVDADSANVVRQFLLHCVQNLSGGAVPSFIINKIAQLFALVFASDFPARWPSFFADLFLTSGDNFSNDSFVLFYLKTLKAIDDEVVNRDIQRTKEKADRNTNIKDAMREICIADIIRSWWIILERSANSTAQSLCLEVIAAFADWIELEMLLANDDFMRHLLPRLADTQTSEGAITAANAVLQKGMDAAKKQQLIQMFSHVFRTNGILTVTEDMDEELLYRTGSLLNTIMLALIECHTAYRAAGNAGQCEMCTSEMRLYVEASLAILDNEDCDVSESVCESLRAYFTIVREKNNEEISRYLSKAVEICMRRYEMPEELKVDSEGEDEIEFRQYRKALRGLMNVVGMKRPDIVISHVECEMGKKRDHVNSMEALAQLVHDFSDIIPSSFVNSNEELYVRAQRFVLLFLEQCTLNGQSSILHVLYFETACRYERVIARVPQPVVALVAAAFLDERGIAFKDEKVRTRIVYLFCRFVKSHRTALSPLVSEVISRLAPMLAVEPNSVQLISAEDQAFLYEATAVLIVFGDIATEQKQQFLHEIATTLANRFVAAASELDRMRSVDPEVAQTIEQFMVNIVGYCTRTSKAFNLTHTMASCNCEQVYVQLLELFASHLTADKTFLLEPFRQLCHRLVACLDSALCPCLPALMQRIASISENDDDLNHLLIFINQIVAKYKTLLVDHGIATPLNEVISRVVSRVANCSDLSTDESAARNRMYVQRGFLQLLLGSLQHGLLRLIVTDTALDELLDLTAQLAMCNDQTSQKVALAVLAKSATDSDARWRRAVTTSVHVPFLNHISPADAGSTLVVHEVATTLLIAQQVDSAVFDSFVQTLLPANAAKQLVTLLSIAKGKELDKQLLMLYAQLKSSKQ